MAAYAWMMQGSYFASEKFVAGVWAFVILVLSLTFHEYGHAWSAKRLGDDTAERLGRLTLNPLKHLDPIFTVILPLYCIFFGGGFLIGMAKPVPVVAERLRHPLRDMMITSAAGPAMNVVLAVFFTGLYWFHIEVRHVEWDRLSSLVIVSGIKLNFLLALFNLLPIPPLDGHRVLGFFLPEPVRKAYYSIGAFGFIIIIVLGARGILGDVMNKVLIPFGDWWLKLMPPDSMNVFR